MTEQTNPEGETTATETDAGGGQWAELFAGEDPAKVRKALDHAREWEKRAKANADAAKKLTEFEDAQKTEAQKLQDQYEEAIGRASRAENDLARERVARKHGLDDDLLQFLTGETEEELEARAKVLAERLGERKTAQARRPDPSQGRGSDMALNGDPLLNDLKSKLGIH